jgi:proteasome lid subunit RPN8/RPN11
MTERERHTLRLSRPLRQRLTRWVSAGYPQETCGLLLGQREDLITDVEDLVQARNLNRERPGDRYELDPADFAKADGSARERGLGHDGVAGLRSWWLQDDDFVEEIIEP